MARSDETESDRDRNTDDTRQTTRTESRSGVVGWFAESTIRLVLAGLGILLLLFAVGQMVGFDILEAIAAVLDTEIGRWFLVAVFALLLIVVALRGFYAQPE